MICKNKKKYHKYAKNSGKMREKSETGYILYIMKSSHLKMIRLIHSIQINHQMTYLDITNYNLCKNVNM